MEDELEDDDEDFNNDDEGDLECFPDDPIICEILGEDLLALLLECLLLDDDDDDECFDDDDDDPDPELDL